jgi:hypothetical protein
MGESRNGYRILVRKAEGKKPLRRLRRMWVDNIKMDGKVWTELIWLRTESSVELL